MSGNGEIDDDSLLEYDDLLEREAPEWARTAPSLEGPGAASQDWAAYFTALKAEALARGEGIKVQPPTKTVILLEHDFSDAELAGAAKSLVARLREAGWRISLGRSTVWVTDEFYADDAKKAPGEEVPKHRKGDLKKPAHEEKHLWIDAAFPAARVLFRASFFLGKTPKGATSVKFNSANAIDPIGMPQQLWADYSLDANAVKQQKDEPGWAHRQRVARLEANATRLDRDYNERLDWINHRPLFTKSGEFDTWLDETLTITNPKPHSENRETHDRTDERHLP